MVTFQKYFVYIISTILMAASIIFMPSISDTLSSIYMLTIGAFLGIDLATTILKTKALPEGEFKPLKKDRYLVCSIMSSILITLALIVEKKMNVVLIGTLTTMSMTLMAIGALFIAGLESVKMVTGSPVKEDKKE